MRPGTPGDAFPAELEAIAREYFELYPPLARA